MKKFPIAAAALLFGTSAYAMLPSAEPTGVTVQKDPWVVQPAATVAPAYDEAPALQPAAMDDWAMAEPVAYPTDDYTTDEVKVAAMDDQAVTADTQFATDKDAMADDAGFIPADATAQPEVRNATYTTGFGAGDEAAVETTAMTDSDAVYAAATETASADLAPRPAAQNYPACSPGRGDDRCIQLYEPGVREELAAWTQPTGGFAGAADTRMAAADAPLDDSQVAMGGPYEPIDSATETERLNQQALADSASAVQVAEAKAVTADEPLDDSAVETAMADDQGNVPTDDDEDLAGV